MRQDLKGQFIVLEGGEGTGKSSVLYSVKTVLEGMNLDVVATREPGGTLFGEKVRELMLSTKDHNISSMTELLLMTAQRTDHVEKVITPALEQGKVVLCDRFDLSTEIYQGENIDNFHDIYNTIKPNININKIFVLYVNDKHIDKVMKRIENRMDGNRFDYLPVQFHKDVNQKYKEIAEANKGKNIHLIDIIDENGDPKTIVQITREILDIL